MRRFIFSLLIVIAASFAAGQSTAQDVAPKQSGSYEKTTATTLSAWEQTARRAEESIEAGRASTTAFEELRAQLVTWREKFLVAQSTNEGSIKTLQAQIDALGPKAEGIEEVPEIAIQRVELDRRMGQLRAPTKTAEIAYSRADGLIRGVDEIIRARQTDALLKRGPSPLNPLYLARGWEAIKLSTRNITKEITTAWNSQTQQVLLKENLPVIVVLTLIAFVLLMRGRHWMERLTFTVQANKRTAGRWALAFLLSIAQVGLPLIGLTLLIEAIYATELVGVRGNIFLSAFISLAVAFFLARWIGGRIFPKSEYIVPPLNLAPALRRKGRFYSAALGLMLGINIMIRSIGQFDSWSVEAIISVTFPVLLLTGYGVLRLSRLMRQHVQNDQVEGEERIYRNRIMYYLSRIVLAVAFAGPILAVIGYFDAAKFIIFPTVMTLGLSSFLLLLHRMIGEIFAIMVGGDERAREALIPVLISFTMVLGSLPVFALIWGVRVADLTELWARFKEGFLIGDVRISPSDFLTFAIVFAIGYMATRLIQGTLRTTVLPKTKMDVGGQNAVVSGIGYIGIFLAAMAAISSAGIDLSSLAIVAGALSVGIGFGLQNIVSNFVSGIILLIERPISEGDWIEVGSHMGYVRDISVRSTRIETFDRTDVIVPNSDLVSGVVTNWTRGNSVGRVIVPVGVAYGTDTKRVEALLRQIAEAHPMVLANPGVIFQGFGADSLDFEIRAILRDVNWILSVKSDINHEIARIFTEEGIEIPFAQRDVWLRNPEALNPAPQKPTRAAKKPASKGSTK